MTTVTERMVGALDGQLNLDVGRIDKIKLLPLIHDAKFSRIRNDLQDCIQQDN